MFYFTPLFTVLFTFPSQYWFTIGLLVVFSLTGWSPLFQTGFLVSRPTQDITIIYQSYQYGNITLYVIPFQVFLVQLIYQYRDPTTPTLPKQYWFGLFPFRSPLLRKSMFLSFPTGNEMFQFPVLALFAECCTFIATGCPIRICADQLMFANPRTFSQLTTSFFAARSLGILRSPLFAS